MNISIETLHRAIGGHTHAPTDWVAPSSFRYLVRDNPCGLWLKHHGAAHGFAPNTNPHSLLNFLSRKGQEFERKYIQEMFPEAVYATTHEDSATDVRSFFKTLELLMRDEPVIAAAVLWWDEGRVFGTADLLVKASVLFGDGKYPSLKPAGWDKLDVYVVLDAKASTNLDQGAKRLDFACYTYQVQVYSYILSQLQGAAANIAYLVTKDRMDDPLPIPCPAGLGEPLPTAIRELCDQATHIKLHCGDKVPWLDAEVAANPLDHHTEPWGEAMNQILWQKSSPVPLERIPRIGKKAGRLRELGFKSLDEVLAVEPRHVPFEKLSGLNEKHIARIRLVLEANRSQTVIWPDKSVVPRRTVHEYAIDIEYFTPINFSVDNWPNLEGCPIIFMVGVGYMDDGEYTYKQFTSAAESYDAEHDMLSEFLAWLSDREVLSHPDAVLWHWSPAERTQFRKAADRTGLTALALLPLKDLAVIAEQLGMPGVWNNKLKSVAKHLGHSWPDLDAGGEAMVMAWAAYQQPDPTETQLMRDVGEYLSADVQALYIVLEKMRAASTETRTARQATERDRERAASMPQPLPRPLPLSWWPQSASASEILSEGKCWYRLTTPDFV